MERRRRGFLELLEVLNEGGRGGDVVEFMGVEAEFVGGGGVVVRSAGIYMFHQCDAKAITFFDLRENDYAKLLKKPRSKNVMGFHFQFAECFLVLFCFLGRLVPRLAVCVVIDVLSCLSGFSDGFLPCSDWIWCFSSLCHRRVCSFLVVIWVLGFRWGSCVFLLFVRHFWLFV